MIAEVASQVKKYLQLCGVVTWARIYESCFFARLTDGLCVQGWQPGAWMLRFSGS